MGLNIEGPWAGDAKGSVEALEGQSSAQSWRSRAGHPLRQPGVASRPHNNN